MSWAEVVLAQPEMPADPGLASDERTTLTEFVDYQRAVMLRKVGGLDDDGLRRVMTPSGLTLLGMLKHLAYVEQWWFRIAFAGEPGLERPWTEEDPDPDWRIEPGETADEILALYLDEVSRAREITAGAASFDAVAADPRANGRTLRWIMVHVLEEYARHLGHADIMREAIDGATGD